MENHETRLKENEERKKASEERMAKIELKLLEAGDKLDALISFVQRQHGFPEIQ